MDPNKDANAESIKQALLNYRRRPTLEFQEFLDALDSMGLHITLYLMGELKISSGVVPKLLPLIDPRCFDARLKFEIDDLLKKLEDGPAQ